MHTAVGTTGPVSIAYDVIAGFRFYKKGVYSKLANLFDYSLLSNT